MSKIKKADLLQLVQEQAEMIAELSGMVELNKMSIIKLENEREKPQLKQLDQSIFDGLDKKWRFAAVDADGSANGFDVRVYPRGGDKYGLFAYADDYANSDDNSIQLGEGYDTSNWQNSLIEREKKELTGSELCKAMLARGDKYVLCIVSPYRDAIDNGSVILPKIVTTFHEYGFITTNGKWAYATPINNQGEPLTAAEVGL